MSRCVEFYVCLILSQREYKNPAVRRLDVFILFVLFTEMKEGDGAVRVYVMVRIIYLPSSRIQQLLRECC